jgi:cell volume regulation protein A
VEVGELRLPVGASVALVVRDGETRVPDERTVLRRGDDLLVVTPRRLREATEDRLRAVSLRGRLAQWLDQPREPAASPEPGRLRQPGTGG